MKESYISKSVVYINDKPKTNRPKPNSNRPKGNKRMKKRCPHCGARIKAKTPKREKTDKDRIEEIHNKRFLTGIDYHRGGYNGPDMIRGGG